MGFFDKNKNKNYNEDEDYGYMDNSEAYGFKYNSKDDYNEYQDQDQYPNQYQNENRTNFHNYNQQNVEDRNSQRLSKQENRYKNKYVKKSRKDSRKKALSDYGYSTGYEEEQIYYDEDGVEILNTHKIDFKTIVVRVSLFFYVIFILIGALGTTFSDGYKAQIISPTVRGERITYSNCQKQMEFLEGLDDFKGVSELQTLYKTGGYQARIAPLKKSLSEIDKRIEDMKSAAYKVKDNDYVDIEMIGMVSDLMQTEKETTTQTIRFYESMSGYSSTTDDLKASQTKLLDQQQVYKNKLSNYKMRFEQLKTYDLKLAN